MRLLKYLFIFSIVFSAEYIDVIKLEDGSVIKGKIIENKILEYVKVELTGGSILIFDYDEIKSFEVQKIQGNPNSLNLGSSYNPNSLNLGSSYNSNSLNPGSSDCYIEGLNKGQQISTTGTTAGGVFSGFAFGLIGWGISYAFVANSNSDPNPLLYNNNRYSNCAPSFIQGYKEGALKSKKKAIHTGNALGILILLLYISNDDYYY
tara:strand:+ start:226 stop:843 length:618 start_codon:yes stop_codon:yes gene_type:complete